ncbi:MAG: hypothetical protein ACF8R7_10175, partial [Phycisphaerales bacterium JB039]
MLWSELEGGAAPAARWRAVIAVACFGTGIALGAGAPGAAGSMALASAAVSAAGLGIALPRARAIALAVAAVALGAAWQALRLGEAPAQAIVWHAPADPLEERLLVVEGTLLEDPALEPAPEGFAFVRPARWRAPVQVGRVRAGGAWR